MVIQSPKVDYQVFDSQSLEQLTFKRRQTRYVWRYVSLSLEEGLYEPDRGLPVRLLTNQFGRLFENSKQLSKTHLVTRTIRPYGVSVPLAGYASVKVMHCKHGLTDGAWPQIESSFGFCGSAVASIKEMIRLSLHYWGLNTVIEISKWYLDTATERWRLGHF